MAKKFHAQELAYKRDVHGITLTQVGLSVEAASARFQVTLKEFQRAQTEAKAVASLLREANTQFTSLRGKLESARKDAVKAGMKVSDQGVVSFDTEKLSKGERTAWVHDRDYQDSVRKSVSSWQQLIDQRVKDVGDADVDVQRALTAVVVDSDTGDGVVGGFNGQAKGQIAAYPPQKDVGTKPDGHGGFKLTGPGFGYSISGDPKYGKEGSAKVYADLFHLTWKGSHTDGAWKLSGIGDVYGGARATANYGFSDKGVSGKAEASIGIRDLEEVRLDYGDLGGVYGRTDGFAGAEVGVTAKATKDEATVGVKAFYGAKQSIAGGVEVAGIGIGGTAEAGVGEGTDAWIGWKHKNGVWKFGGRGFAAAAVGGGGGVEITVDTHKLGKAVDSAADAVGDLAGSVKDTLGGLL
ncbi:hypothetical protein [Streptomyces sp. NPDC007205]|uniref:hypothetical protein n=1 Tax=Streptomyces sp. NPDC007205 TaxID=3154316 RepID=UPI0033D8AE73